MEMREAARDTESPPRATLVWLDRGACALPDWARELIVGRAHVAARARKRISGRLVVFVEVATDRDDRAYACIDKQRYRVTPEGLEPTGAWPEPPELCDRRGT